MSDKPETQEPNQDPSTAAQAQADMAAEDTRSEAEIDAAVRASVEEGMADITALQQELEVAKAKADEARDQLMRTFAELENQKRRHAQELEKAHKFALEGMVNAMLAVWDSLELGVKAAADPAADVEKLREGNALTLKLLADTMNKFGVVQIDPLNQPFDPELHQAMVMQPNAEVAENTVIDVFQKGYQLNGRLVRPAMVVVSQQAL